MMGVNRFARGFVVLVLIVFNLAACGPLGTASYRDGSFMHLQYPRYTFEIPDGWRPATAADYPALGFNRRAFETMDDKKRGAFLERAEDELRVLDTGLISARGAWIQVASRAGAGGWYNSRKRLEFGLGDGEKKAVWQRLSTGLIEHAPPGDKPKLTLDSMDVIDYGQNRVLQVRFRSDESRGSLHWTVLGFYNESDTVFMAHVGTPDDPKEGLAGLESIAYSFRFNE